jgi:hypothetical protein
MERISRVQIERENWIPSIGVPFDKEHFREPPPGRRHAVFELGTAYGVVHQDQHNPYASPGDLVNHLWDWSPIGTIVLGYIGYKFLRNL